MIKVLRMVPLYLITFNLVDINLPCLKFFIIFCRRFTHCMVSTYFTPDFVVKHIITVYHTRAYNSISKRVLIINWKPCILFVGTILLYYVLYNWYNVNSTRVQGQDIQITSITSVESLCIESNLSLPLGAKTTRNSKFLRPTVIKDWLITNK